MAVSTISGAIKWTGLASETDFGRVVQQLVAIEQRTITRQETWKREWVSKLTAINGLDTRLSGLKLDAQSYDTREKLLSRAAVSSDERVLTLTNLSTAPPGNYEVEVGSNIREKFASGSYLETKPIGLNIKKDPKGELLDANGNLLGYYINDAGYQTDADGKILFDEKHSDLSFEESNIRKNAEGFPLDEDDNIIYDALTPFPEGIGPQPFTITMNGKTLKLDFNPRAEPGAPGVYNGSFTMEDLAKSINATVTVNGDSGPIVSASVIFDKTRSGETYSRLVITGGEGGSANSISVSDPTNLGMGQKRFDQPVTTGLIGTTARPTVDENLVYTGHTNKTITFVPMNSGVLGEDDITISWADTNDLHRGSFTIKAEDWDAENGRLKEDVAIIQGLKINFSFGDRGTFYANEVFTIDCQAPVLQQAADSGMASTDKWIHKGWPDQTSRVHSGGGVFLFTYAGKEHSISLSGDLTLNGLVERINGFAGNPGVIASVINDGMGTATSYKLVLTGAHTGMEYGITNVRMRDSGDRIQDGWGPEDFEQSRRASNSMTRFDGYPNDGLSWLQRPTNEVSDVIEGTVVNIMGVGKASIIIKNNITEMTNKIKALVESVNRTKAFIKEHTKWGGGKLVSSVLSDGSMARGTEGGETNGIMIGNYGFQISLSELDRLMTRSIFTADDYLLARYPDYSERAAISRERKFELYDEYLAANGLLYTRLSDIGIISNPDLGGAYVIEESKLTESLNRNPEAVIKLFTFANGDNDFPVNNTVVTHLDEAARPRLQGFSLLLGYRMSDLTRANDVIDPATGKVVNSAKGITKVLAENYNNIVSGIDGKISRETKRIEQYQQRLELKFSRLETALSQLNSTADRVSSQMAQLNNNK